MSSLICPICQTSLKPISIMHSAIWRCESCQAVAANLAVLRRYLKIDVVKDFWFRAITAARSTAKKCPSCRHSLHEFTVRRNGQNINLDICRRCQLVWFDKGELDAFPKTHVEDLSPEVKRNLALLKVGSEAEQQQPLEETTDKVFAILTLERLCVPSFPWYADWIIYLFVGLVRFVVDLRGWLWGMAVTICAIVICIGAYVVFRSPDVVYPEDIFSVDYQRNMSYLASAVVQAPPDFPKIRGGILGAFIPIVKEQDFPRFGDKLRQELREAARSDFFFHIIVVGGMDVRAIDEPLLKASKRLYMLRQDNIEIVIVAPSTISDETKRILEKRGLRIRRIESQLLKDSAESGMK